jgi:hypothetical protein
MKQKNLHLILSIGVVVPAALIYGFNPGATLPVLFDFQVGTTDLKNVFRAIMCLYLMVALAWCLGIAKPQWWKPATLLNVLFMAGLAIGRSLSLFLDGPPSPAFAYGLIGEWVLAGFAAFQFWKYSPK